MIVWRQGGCRSATEGFLLHPVQHRTLIGMPYTNPQRLMVVDDLYGLPDDGWKHELQAGCLVSEPLPGFRHGQIAARLAQLLGAHVYRERLGAVLSNDSGFVLSTSPDTVRGPDVAFVTRERLASFVDRSKAFPGAPDLAVEVRSPSNTAAEIHAKVAEYLAAGTRLVWVVDSEVRTITAYKTLLAPTLIGEGQFLEGQEVVPGFRVGVDELFAI
jgi:Uma2 family endonuclease